MFQNPEVLQNSKETSRNLGQYKRQVLKLLLCRIEKNTEDYKENTVKGYMKDKSLRLMKP